METITTILSEEIADKLRMSILSGEFKNNEKINERKIAEQYGVSRNPVREAIHQLEIEGYVERKNFAGVRIKAITPYTLTESIELYLIITKLILKEAIANYTQTTYHNFAQLIKDLTAANDYKTHSLVSWDLIKETYAPANKPFCLQIIKNLYFTNKRYSLEFEETFTNNSKVLHSYNKFLDYCQQGKFTEAYTSRIMLIESLLRYHQKAQKVNTSVTYKY